MQTNLLKTVHNVALTFHMWLDISQEKKMGFFLFTAISCRCFFFICRISFRLSEAKAKGKIKCNTAAVYLFGRFFLKLFSCLTSYSIIVLKLQYCCNLLSYFPYMLSYKGSGIDFFFGTN